MPLDANRIQQVLRAPLCRRLRAAAEYLARQVRLNISIDSQDGRHRSQPFAFPHKETGQLLESITVSIDCQAGRATVGSSLEYAAHLEFGTASMLPRPFLARTALEEAPTLKRLLNQGE